jgi:hypothetical protein
MGQLWLGCVVALAVSGCDLDSVSDRLSMELTGGAPIQRIDIDPTSVAAGIDNTVAIDVVFDEEEGGTGANADSVVFTQYRIDFLLDGEEAPYIAGNIELEIASAGAASIVVRAVAEPQLSWVAERYNGGELDVQARVHLAGVYNDDDELILLTHEFIASFADYE